MKLSQLAYNCVKGVKYLDDSSFTYEAFRRGDFDNDLDYSNSINNVFGALNRAVHRLSDLDKIPFKVAENIVPVDMVVDLSDLPIKAIQSVFVFVGDDYRRLDYREFGQGKIRLLGQFQPEKVNVEYSEDIKHFDSDDWKYETELDQEQDLLVEEYDIDLKKDYGISDTMCSYIEEYVKGVLFEDVSPSLANMHVTRAEQYFANLPDCQTTFHQTRVHAKFRIE